VKRLNVARACEEQERVTVETGGHRHMEQQRQGESDALLCCFVVLLCCVALLCCFVVLLCCVALLCCFVVLLCEISC